MKKARLD